jgi:heme-degrading monooxygenase HmoA
MGLAVFIVKFKDYDKLEAAIIEDIPLLKANGGKSASILRDLDDPNRVIFTAEWENMENAKKFAESDELSARMQEGGVTGKPEILFCRREKGILTP